MEAVHDLVDDLSAPFVCHYYETMAERLVHLNPTENKTAIAIEASFYQQVRSIFFQRGDMMFSWNATIDDGSGSSKTTTSVTNQIGYSYLLSSVGVLRELSRDQCR